MSFSVAGGQIVLTEQANCVLCLCPDNWLLLVASYLMGRYESGINFLIVWLFLKCQTITKTTDSSWQHCCFANCAMKLSATEMKS